MKMEFRYIYFEPCPDPNRLLTAKTFRWYCINKKLELRLGSVAWESGWRRYSFFPVANTVFSADCLEDIRHFLDDVNADYKNKIIKTRKPPPKRRGMIKS